MNKMLSQDLFDVFENDVIWHRSGKLKKLKVSAVFATTRSYFEIDLHNAYSAI